MESALFSELKKSVHSPPKPGAKKLFLHTCAFLALMSPGAALANPQDGVVTGGSATIAENGTTLTIDQTSSRAIIDWRSFDIAPGETTRFNQPSSTSVALNRVRASDPSYLLGTLSANGNVILVNPSGVFFGSSAVVDVAGLVATTADIRNEDFMAGNYNFGIAGNPNARIVNEGLITARDAGLVGLVAPNVENSGVIEAHLGKVALASGDTFTLDMYGDNLITVAVSDSVTDQIVSNTGKIEAAGGTIEMTAAAGRNVVNSLITVAGELQAPVAESRGGKIIIGAAGSNHTAKTGQSKVLVSGTIDASAKYVGGTGGMVTITGDQVGLIGGAYIDASGYAGGGTVLIGGDYQGTGDTQRSLQTYFGSGVAVDVSAIENGRGGKAILWSDNNTQFYGTITARGASAGDGGFVETSGHAHLMADGIVDASAQNGNGGEWLLDPADITINNAADANVTGNPNFTATGAGSHISATSIVNNLNAGTNVTITTSNDGFAGNGDITVSSAITATGSGSLTLSAYRNVFINASIDINGGAVTLRADNTGIGSGGIETNNGAAITSHGGNITMGGGSGAITAGSGFATGNAVLTSGVHIGYGSTIDASGGNIILNGVSYSDTTSVYGVNINGIVKTSGTGTISITGAAQGTGDQSQGVYMSGLGSATPVIESSGGAISITGTSTVTAAGSYGVMIDGSGGQAKILSTSGAININGTGSANAVTAGHGIRLKTDVQIVSSSGNITITASAPTIGDAINANGASAINAGSGALTLNVDQWAAAMNTVTMTTTGVLTVANNTAGKTIGIGTGSSNVQITDAYLAYLNGGSYVFGSTTSGDLTINTTKDFADKSVTFISGQDINLAGTLTKTTGTGTANYLFQANRDIYNSSSATITTASGKINLTLDADYDQATVLGGAIYLSGGTFSSNGGNIILSGGSNVTTGYAYGRSGHVEGIRLSGTTFNSGAGSLTVRGHGYDAGSDAYGIYLVSVGRLLSDAALTVTGVGGGGTTGTGNYGVYINSANSTIRTTGTGLLSVTGSGGNATGSGGGNHGIAVAVSSVNAIQATGAGAITLTGTGGNNAGGTGTNNYGVSLVGSIAANGGLVTINGTGGNSTGSGTANYGLSLAGNITNTNGNITIIATGVGASNGFANGFRMSSGTIDGGSGTIDITGIRGSTDTACDFNITGGTIGSGTTTGAIKLHADTFSMSAGTIQTSGTLTIDNRTAGTTIGIGSGAGTLGLTNTILGFMTAGSYIFGSTTSGDLTINTTKDFADKNLTFMSGRDISVAGTLTKATGAGTANYLFQANRDIYNVTNQGISATSGMINLTLNSDYDQATVLGGIINLSSGTFATNGGNIIMGGGTNPLTGSSWGYSGNATGIVVAGATINAGGGNITIHSHGYDDASTSNHSGFAIYSNGKIQTIGTGNIDITAIGGAGVSFTLGLNLGGTTLIQAAAGNINLVGTAGAATVNGGNHGVSMYGGTTILTTSGNINVTGTRSIDSDIYIGNTSNIIGNGSTTGNITLTGDKDFWDSSFTATTTGTITIANRAAGTTINIGSGASTLNINDTYLNALIAGSYVFGSVTSGTVVVNTAHDFGNSNVTFMSGQDINLAGTLTKATGTGAATYLLQADRDISNSSSAGIVATSGKINLTLDSDYDEDRSGLSVLTSSTITTNGGSLTIGAGTAPATDNSMGGGVQLVTSTISTGAGAVKIHGYTAGSSGYSGLAITNSNITTTSGNIELIGKTTSSSTYPHGLWISGATATPSQITSTSGDITLIGIGSPNASIASDALRFNGEILINTASGATSMTGYSTTGSDFLSVSQTPTTRLRIGSSTSTGNITIALDDIVLDFTTADSYIQTLGTLTVQNYTAGTTMGLGAGTGTIQFNATEVSRLIAGSYVFGSTTSGDVTVNTTRDFSDSNITFISGRDINLAGTLTKATGAGTANYLFQANRAIYNTSSAGITRSVGAINLTVDADYDNNNDGYINLTGGAITTGGGNITMGGGSAAITAGSGYAVGNATSVTGISLTGTIDASGGNILINGRGAALASNTNPGVYISNGVQTSGSGTITIYGTGGGTSAANTNFGVELDTASGKLQTVNGAITVNATAGTGKAFNYGIFLNASTITTVTGAINLTGVGGSAGTAVANTANHGIYTHTATISSTGTGAGAMTIIGTGGPGNNADNGLSVYNTSILMVDAPITITGIAGESGTEGINLIGADAIGNGSTTGNITLITDKIILGSSAVTTGTFTLKPYTANTTMGLGTGAGTLSLGNTQLGQINAGTYVFGSTITGDLTINTTRDFGNKNVSFISGNDITLAGTLTKASGTGTVSYVFKSNRNFSNSGGAGIATNSGKANLVFWSDVDQATTPGGNIAFTSGNLTTGGGDVWMGGGADDGANGGTAGDGRPDNSTYSAAGNGISIVTTNINAGGGNITARGYGAGRGIIINQGSVVKTSGTGKITLIGEAYGNGGAQAYGVNINGQNTEVQTQNGDITIVGNGYGSSANIGTAIESTIAYALVDTTGSGSISITGQSAASAFDLYVANSRLLTGTGGNITLISNTNGVGTSSIVSTPGTFTYANRSAGTVVSVGAGGGLNVSNGTLGIITAGAYVFGSTTSGDVTVSTTKDFGDSSVTFISGRDIILAGTLTKATGTATAGYLFQANRDIYNTGNTGIVASNGKINLTLNSDYDQATVLGGYVKLGGSGNFNTNGGNLIIGGGSDPTTSYATSTDTNNVGVYIYGPTVSTGAGNILIHGMNASATGDYLMGFYSGSMNMSTTTGNITIYGTVLSNGIEPYGIFMQNSGAQITTVSGAVTLNGSGGNSANGVGVRLRAGAGITSTGTGTVGDIMLIGTSLMGITNGVDTSGATISTQDANVIAQSTNTTGGASVGTVNTNGSAGKGNVTLIGNTANISSASIISGVLTVKPYTAGTALSIGANIASTLNFAAAALTNVTAGSYVFGSANAGNITINTTQDFGDKNITFISSNDINIAGNLTKATGSGTASYLFQANRSIYNSASAGISAASGKINITMNADYDQATVLGGAIYLTSGTFSSNGGNIVLSGGSNTATGYAYGISGHVEGIRLDGAIVDSGAGTLTARGHGYDSGASNFGVYLISAGKLLSSGALSVTGAGGGSGANNGNYGVYIAGANSTIRTSGTSALSVTGTGGNTSGINNLGIWISSTNGIQATSTGAITVTGTGGGTGSTNQGIGVYSNGSITGAGGAMTITGQGSTTGTGNNYGIELYNNGSISNSGAGDVIITGTGGGSGTGGSNYGVYIHSIGTNFIATSGSGNLYVTGLGGNGTGGSNHGIYARLANSITSSGSGSITLKGKAGATSGTAAYLETANNVKTTGTGNITVYADSLSMSNANTISSASILTLAPYTNIGMSVGTNVGSTLNVSDTYLGYINGASYVFGATTVGNGTAATGTLTINTAQDFGDKNVSFISGSNISIAGNLTKASGTGTANYLFLANTNITLQTGVSVQPTSGKLNLTFNSDYDQASNVGGYIYISGNVQILSGGGDIVMGGGTNPLTGYAYGIDTYGIFINTGTLISSGNGNITMHGLTTGSNSVHGIALYGAIKSTVGNISLDAVSSSTGNSAHAMAINGGGGAAGIETTSGLISIKARTTTSNNVALVQWVDTYIRSLGSGSILLDLYSSVNSDFYSNAGTSSIVGGAAMTGDITIYATDSNAWGNNLSITTAGKLTWMSANGESFGIGSALAGTNKLLESQLNTMTAGSYVFGTSGSGDLTVNTTKDFGDKSVTFVSGNDINIAGNLIKASGTGTASYLFQANRDIYNSSGAGISATSGKINLTLQSDFDQTTVLGGAIKLTNGSFLSNGGDIIFSGGANVATGYAYGGTTNTSGIRIDGATVDSGVGMLSLRAHGYDSAASYGVCVLNGGKLISGGALTIVGIGGGAGTDTDNYGVYVTGTNSTIKNTGSNLLSVTGTGGNATGSGTRNYGIALDAINAVNATGSGAITLNGTGGSGSGSGNFNAGISIIGSVVGSGGLITANGTGGNSTAGNNYGMRISGNITNANGDITIAATGRGQGGGSLGDHGFYMFGGNIDGGSGVISIAGTVNAPAGLGYYITSGSIGSGTTSGAISLKANTMSISGWSAQTSGSLSIANYNSNQTIGLGSGTGTLALTDAMLNLLNAGSYIFGAANAGDVTVNTTHDFGNSNVTFISGRDIILAGTLTKATGTGTANYLLQADRDIYNSSSAGILTSNGKVNLVLNADRNADHNGAIKLSGASFITGGGYAVLGGGSGALGGTNGILGDGDGIGADDVSVWGNSTNKHGILLSSSINAGGGDIILNGSGWQDSSCSNNCFGINILGTLQTIGSGRILFTGTGGGTTGTTYGHGMYIGNSTLSTVDGDIVLSGQTIGTDSTNMGIAFNSTVLNTTNGNISLVLPSGSFYAGGTTSTITAARNITFTGDKLDVSQAFTFNAGGILTVKTYTAGTTQSIGVTTSTLGLSNTLLGGFTAGSYVFGSTAAGTLTINTTKNFGDSHVTFISGQDIIIAGNLTKTSGTGTANYLFQANRDVFNSGSAGISASNGVINVIMNADHDANQNGAVTLSGATITTSGGYIVMGGGAGALGGTNGVLGDGDGAGADDVAAYGSSGSVTNGVSLTSSTLNAAGGSIFIRGTGYNSTASNRGVLVSASTLTTTGAGTIGIRGITQGITTGGGDNFGIYVTSTSTIRTQNGALTLSGTGTGSNGGANSMGIYMDSGSGSGLIQTTGSGNINIIGNVTGGPFVTANNKGAYLMGTIASLGGGNINIAGTGGNGSNSYNIGLQINAAISTTDTGSLSITGTGGDGGANAWGVLLQGGTFSTVNGTLTLTGIGGTSTSSSSHGINISGTTVQTTGTGALNISGTGGTNVSNAYGISITAGSLQTTGSGNISVTGNGGTGSGANHGISVAVANGIHASGSGAITVTGNAYGTGASSGVFVSVGTITGGGGAMTIVGNGSALSTADNNRGINVTTSGAITNIGSGSLTLTGTGGGTGTTANNYGVVVSPGAVSTVNGLLTLSGTGGGGTGGGNHGIRSSSVNGISTSGTGSIILNGIAGGGAASYGLYINSANGLSTTGTGNITVNVDSLGLNLANNINTAGTLTLAPYTAGATMAIGTTGSTLNISTTQLGYTSAASYIFGSTTSGDLTLNTTYDFADRNITFISGTDINISGNLAKASGTGTASYVFNANHHIFNTGGADILATVGKINLTMNSDVDHATVPGGDISFTGMNFGVNGGTIVLGSNGGSINLAGSTTLGGDAALTSSNGAITIGTLEADTANTRNLTINAGAGALTTNGTLGAVTRLQNLSVTADGIALGGNIRGSGTLTLAPATANTAMHFNRAGSGFDMSATEIGYIQPGWTGITIGRTGATGGIDVQNVTFNAPVTWVGAGNTLSVYGTLDTSGSAFNTSNIASVTLASGSNAQILTSGANITLSDLNIQADGANTATINSTNGNITVNGTVTGSGARTVTINAGTGNIAFGNTINGGMNLVVTANGVSFANNIGGSTALSALNLTAVSNITLPGINAGSIFIRATGAGSDITIGSGKTLTASGAGTAITLVANDDFFNQAVTPFAMTGGGRWLVYSTNPADNTMNGLTPGFVRYNCTYAGSCPSFAAQTGNGMLYTYTPTLTVTPQTLADLAQGSSVPSLAGYVYNVAGYLTAADQTADMLSGVLNGTTDYTGASPIGTYYINYSTGSLVSALGYGFTYVNNNAAIVVTQNAAPPPAPVIPALPSTVEPERNNTQNSNFDQVLKFDSNNGNTLGNGGSFIAIDPSFARFLELDCGRVGIKCGDFSQQDDRDKFEDVIGLN